MSRHLSPSQLMPNLYACLWSSGAVRDMKALADAKPLGTPADIEAAFLKEAPACDDTLRAFVAHWFEPPPPPSTPPPTASIALTDHIDRLWDHLVRRPAPLPVLGSLVPLSHAHIVPGGMFRECYYWDSYFTIIGLGDHRGDLKAECVAALAEQIDRFGHVPNGTRSYYLSRSQPPTFYASVAALTPEAPERSWQRYLPQLQREHAYWMRGEDEIEPGHAAACVARLPDGSLLNRYWDPVGMPRDEASSGRDVRIAEAARPRNAEHVYRDIRAACASGWDFSSRWFEDRQTMATIRTTAILPVDLNALLFGLETAIARGAALGGDVALASAFQRRSQRRRQAITTWLWNDQTGVFDDFDIETMQRRGAISAATFVPLFSGCASPDQAASVAEYAVMALLAAGGLKVTSLRTGEQWDAPNGWAPCHWMAVKGLAAYGFNDLAQDIARRWLETVARLYARTGRLMEKYDVERERPGGGGEYPLQDGFGWTNGVTAALLRDYPSLGHLGGTMGPALGRLDAD